MIPQLELYDFCLLIIYLFVIYLGAILYVQKKKKEDPIYRYFIPALSLKIAGGLVYALYHVYIYKGGDTFVFFNAASDLVNYVSVFGSSSWDVYWSSFDSSYHDFSPNYNYILGGPDVFLVVKITSVFCFLGGMSYYTTTLLFSVFSFVGLWLLFITFSRLYYNVIKLFFYSVFTMPTMLLWSSGVLKDTITIGLFGLIIYCIANIFIFNEKKLGSFFYFFISVYIIFMLKPYLVYLLLPALFIWVQSNIKAKISSSFIKVLVTPLLLITISIVGFYTLSSLSETAGKYSIDNWENTLQGFHSWHGHLTETDHQSGYSLGEMDYTILGVLAKAPTAINVTFFRPYIWEVRNIATLLGALEGLTILFLTVFVILKTRLKIFPIIINNKEVLFLLSLAIPLAFIVGLSSYNFGALSRYKIPAELFYLMTLALIYKTSFKTVK